MNPLISIIIPCYNQGHYLKEALESLVSCDSELYEIIIVNDGSTDDYTNAYIADIQQLGYNVIFQENKGLPGARNTGIQLAKGEYILPLDADNKILPEYLTQAADILKSYPNVAVVYADAFFFGEREGLWKIGAFNLQRLMIHNYIDACAVIRKSVLTEVGLYDTDMRKGWEDWELWLRIGFSGYDFFYIEKPLFKYRVAKNSMSGLILKDYSKRNGIENYIHRKYPDKMGHQWIVEWLIGRFKKNPVLFIIKLLLKAYCPKAYGWLLSKNKIHNGL